MALLEPNQRGKLRRRALHVGSVAGRALLQIDVLAARLFARQLLLREWGRLMELAPQPWKDKKGEMIKFVLDLDEPTRGVLDILPQFYCEFQLFFQEIAHRSMAFEWFSTEEISAD